MSYQKRILSACIFICLALAGISRADDPRLLPRAGVLVLHTGRVLRGDILRVGDRYVVALTQQDELTVPVASVEMRCDSLDDAYQRKRSLLPPHAKVADHLQLAEWCLRYELMPAAAEQLMAAQRRDPLDEANARFEKRLRLAAYRPAKTTTSTAVTSPIASQNELDELMRGLPSGMVEEFTNTIQPLLINSCGASSCHGPNTQSEFQLVYPNWSRTIPRRFTQRNLKRVYELLDHEQPARSPLLMMATLAHSDAHKPPLSEDDVTQLQSLAAWAYRSMDSTNLPPPSVLKAPDALLLQPSSNSATSVADADWSDERERAANRFDPAVQRASHVEPVSPAIKPTPPQGVDPFDPEIFNRRFLK